MLSINIRKSATGFTLMEVMLVIAILGILSSIAIVSYSRYVNSAKCVPVEVAVQNTMLALVRAYANSGTAPTGAGFSNSHTIDGETVSYDTNIVVSFSGNGTQTNPFIVNGQRSNPVCNNGDGIYTLVQGQSMGTW